MAREKMRGRSNVHDIQNEKVCSIKEASRHYALQRVFKVTRAFQLWTAVLCTIIYITAIALNVQYSSSAWPVFTGLLIFISTGIKAVVYKYCPQTNCSVFVYMAISIISAIYSTMAMLTIIGIRETSNMSVITRKCHRHSTQCIKRPLLSETIIDILWLLVLLAEIGCGLAVAAVSYCTSKCCRNVIKQCTQSPGNVTLQDEKCITPAPSQDHEAPKTSAEYATVIIHSQGENDIDDEEMNDARTTASIQKHNKIQADGSTGMNSKGPEEDYIFMTGHCDRSDYEVMKNVTYENARLGNITASERATNQDNLKDEGLAEDGNCKIPGPSQDSVAPPTTSAVYANVIIH